MSSIPGRLGRVAWVGLALLVVSLEPALVVAETEATVEAEAPEVSTGVRETRLIGNAKVGRRKWVTGAAVLVHPESGPSELYVTATDEKGIFRFESLPEGEYHVRLLKHGLEPVIKNRVHLAFPFRAVVEVTMQPATGPAPTPAVRTAPPASSEDACLEGRISKRDGNPAGEVRIRLVRADGSTDPRSALTDAEGAFEISAVSTGDWRLEILGAGFLPIRVPVGLTGDVRLEAVLVPQPANYEPQPLDLMPPELPIPPPEPQTEATDSGADL